MNISGMEPDRTPPQQQQDVQPGREREMTPLPVTDPRRPGTGRLGSGGNFI